MISDDLREYIEAAESRNLLKRIQGADCNLEIGCLTELMAEKYSDGPLLLFDSIPKYPNGFRVLTNFLYTTRQYALALGFPDNLTNLEVLRLWREREHKMKNIAPRTVESGPVMDNVMEGSHIDLTKFPAPKWHELDGGKYIGTGDIVITRDPDTGRVNLGTYRCCIQSKDTATLWINEYQHGKQIVRKHWSQRKPCPIVVVLGSDVLTWLAATTKASSNVSEYDYAGALRGSGVQVIQSELTGLPIPASAEIALEGELQPVDVESAQEGPFGEWPGYYTHTGQEPILKIKRILHRDEPIILGRPPLIPTYYNYFPRQAARMWDHIEESGISGVKAVWVHLNGLMIVVSIAQQYAGHAAQTLIAAAGINIQGMSRYYVAVDEDIDPSDLGQVLWAMSTRVDPFESIQMVNSNTIDLDPRLSPDKREKGEFMIGRVLIDACKPFQWKDRFPIPNRFSPEFRTEIMTKWKGVLNPA